MFTSLNLGNLGIQAPLDEALTLAADNGFAALDLDTGQLLGLAEQATLADLKERFFAAGVRPGAWGLPVNFREYEESFQAGLAALPRHAALAQALGSPWCSTWVRSFSDSLAYETNMELHARRLRPVAQILADHGCRLGLEFVGPASLRAGHAHAFIHTMEGALQLGARIGTGNVGLLLDCYHWHTSRATLDDLDRLHAAQIVYVHLNDALPNLAIDDLPDLERMLPGASGVIDLAAFLGALGRIGYDGPAAVEPFDATLAALPPAERVRLTAESLRRAGL